MSNLSATLKPQFVLTFFSLELMLMSSTFFSWVPARAERISQLLPWTAWLFYYSFWQKHPLIYFLFFVRSFFYAFPQRDKVITGSNLPVWWSNSLHGCWWWVVKPAVWQSLPWWWRSQEEPRPVLALAWIHASLTTLPCLSDCTHTAKPHRLSGMPWSGLPALREHPEARWWKMTN